MRFNETHPLESQKAGGRRTQLSKEAANRPSQRNLPVAPEFCTCKMCPAAWEGVRGSEHSRTR